ncbi:DNA topoisomerase [Candidatus Saccharibacteria bacterium]|nr:DNA topoisomerase [Candidatus Saccharibacteria bacterium]
MSDKIINNLVIVESPAKARTIANYLGKDFTVMSSVGHIRSIPTDKELKKGEKAIDTDHDFRTIYTIDPDKKKTVAELRAAAKQAKTVWLATDEDREGEAIAWHLSETLGLDPTKTHRIAFHEITRGAIDEAIKNPRHVDMSLVKAQQARQILDRLVGFELSPVVWRKVPGGKSAGRVQSPAVRLLVEKEREIQDFESSFVFKVTGEFAYGITSTRPETTFPSDPSVSETSYTGRPAEPSLKKTNLSASSGIDVSDSEGKESSGESVSEQATRQKSDVEIIKATLSETFPDETTATEFLKSLIGANFHVANVEKSPGTKKPAPPFTTSTLQQTANSVLGFSTRTTMNAAQKLYQSGKITYMRTDSLNLSKQFLAAATTYIKKKFGAEYHQFRTYKTKSAGAQEAHEAIRPTDPGLETAGSTDYEQKLYDLIRRRTLATQMADAKIESTTVTIEIANASAGDSSATRPETTFPSDPSVSETSYTGRPAEPSLRTNLSASSGIDVSDSEGKESSGESVSERAVFIAKGEVVLFDGFLKISPSKTSEELPTLTAGDELVAREITARQTFARPPARYTEGSLVKKLEELGIGRPSTYATIIGTIQTRGYAEKGDSDGIEREVIELRLLASAADVSSRAGSALTSAAATTEPRNDGREGVVREGNSAGKRATVTREIITEKSGATKGKLLPTASGTVLNDFLGDHFTDIVDYDFTARIETELDEIAADKLDKTKMLRAFYDPFHELIDGAKTIDRSAVAGTRHLGIDPKTGKSVLARIGRFGPMLQLGETDDKKEKPRFANFPANARLETITLDQALTMFQLPRVVGKTDDGQEIIASIGRFGPYIKVGSTFTSIKGHDPFTISETDARDLYAAKLAADEKKNIADFGGGLKILNGRYGPYVTDGKKNVKIPQGDDPTKITADQAKKMLANAPAKPARRKFTRQKK